MKRLAVPLVGIFLFIYLAGLGFRPATIPDEARYGEIPREMLASDDWVVPRLNGLRYFEKPVFGYWVNALSIHMFGRNPFALRLPSALSVLLSALMIFLLVRGELSKRTEAFLAAAIFLTSPLVLVIGQIALLDSLLSMLITGAMVCFFLAHRAPTATRKRLLLSLMGICCGLAFLTKGFLAFAVPILAGVPFLLWEGRPRDLLRVPWIPILTASLVALPWSLIIHFREGDFWNYFFWTEHVARFLRPVRGQHPEPLWYFVPVLAGGALPWLIQLPAALPMLLGLRKTHSLVRFALCWFFFPFLFFSLCSGKLIPYILPCFPPLAILVAMGLLAYFQAGKWRAFTISSLALAAVALLGAATISLTCMLGDDAVKIYGDGEEMKCLLGSLGFIVWGSLTLLSGRMGEPRKRLGCYCAALLLFFFMLMFSIPDMALDRKTPGRLLERHAARVTPDAYLISNENLVHAVCWYFERNDVKLLGKEGELTYGLDHDDTKPGRVLSVEGLAEMIRENRGRRPVILVLIKEHYEAHAKRLPAPSFMDADRHFVFALFR